MARATLDAMSLGGMLRPRRRRLSRYAVDRVWLVPHFEKMLYDNAQLATAYLEAWAATGELRYRDVAEGTLDYLLREMRLPEGGFASAQDADTDGVEGSTYVWTPADLERVLGAEDAERAAAHYGVTAAGNFEGATVLRTSGKPPTNLADIRARMLAARDATARSRPVTTRRSRPGTASPSRRSPRAPGGSAATTCSTPPGPARRSSMSA